MVILRQIRFGQKAPTWSKRVSRVNTLLTFLPWLCWALPATAQEIDVRLSIKYILDSVGNRPPGTFSNETNLRNAFDQVNNRAMRRWNRGYRFVITEIQNIADQSEYYNLTSDTLYRGLENEAEANPSAFFWRTNATNVFIVNSFINNAGGGAAIPSLASDAGYELVVFIANTNPPDIIWPHELGHHFDLYHTFDFSDQVGDTRPDPNPFQCAQAFQCPMGGSMECCCATKVANLDAVSGSWSPQEYNDIRFNTMSYHCNQTLDNTRLTGGQLDRWTDATRRYHLGETTGVTYFVDRNNLTSPPYDGYSTDPHRTLAGGVAAANPAGGDIVLIRTGNYNEPMTITKPLTLRATRGTVNLGQ